MLEASNALQVCILRCLDLNSTALCNLYPFHSPAPFAFLKGKDFRVLADGLVGSLSLPTLSQANEINS